MKQRLLRLLHISEKAADIMAALGAVIIVTQMLWITYGVVMRYAFRSPDRYATEATALLLFPVAFVGLTYAMKENALPKVDILTDGLHCRWRRAIERFNLLLMFLVGGFLAVAAARATYSSFLSGAASEILVWPKYLFWAPTSASLVIFAIYAGLRLLVLLIDNENKDRANGVV